MFVPYFFCRSGNGNYQVFLDGAESGSFSADGLFNRHDAGLLRLRFTQLDICSAAQSVRYADVRFRTGSGLLLSRQYYRFAQRLQIYQQSRAFSAFTSLLSALVLLHVFTGNLFLWPFLRFGEGYCIGTINLCLESWLNTRATNKNRGLIMSLYMVTTYLGASIGQLSLNIPDPSGTLVYILISIIFSIALIPVSLTALPAPNIQIFRSTSVREAFKISPVGFACCIVSGILVGSFYLLGTIYASSIGMSIKDVSMFMFFGVFGGLLAQIPLGRLSDLTDRRHVLFYICCALGFIVPAADLLVIKGGWYLAALTMLLGACTFTLYPISVSHINDLVTDAQRVHISGMLILAQSIGLISGPIIVSAGMSLFGPDFFMVAFFIFPAAFIIFTMNRIWKKPDINYINVTPTAPMPTAPTHAFTDLATHDTLLDKAKDLFAEKKH